MSSPNRRLFLGGSDAPKVLGVSDWGTPLDLWREKTGRKVVEIDEARQKRFARGHRLEPFIRDMTIDKLRELGHDVKLIWKNRRHTDPTHRFLRAEIDFEIELDGVLTNVDAKSVGGTARSKWGTEGTDEIPIDYLAQFMHGLGVTGRQTCIAAALRSFDDVELFYVQRDEETIEAMRAKMSRFWIECVKKDRAPDPFNFADVRELFPKSESKAIAATDEIVAYVDELRALRQRMKDLKSREDALRFEIARFMGSHAAISKGPRDLVTWEEEGRELFDLEAFRRSHPDWAALFTKTHTSRVLRLRSANYRT
jgi:predicted phage-related endonuclease